MFGVHCSHSVEFTVCSLHSTVVSDYYILKTPHCTVYTVQCTLYNVNCTVVTKDSGVYSGSVATGHGKPTSVTGAVVLQLMKPRHHSLGIISELTQSLTPENTGRSFK